MIDRRVRRRRSRVAAVITPDLRRLRMALGLQVQSAAALLDEPASLLENQESARSADPVFVESALSKYLDYGSALSRKERCLPVS